MTKIDTGIHMNVAAKLRERGLSAASAAALATLKLTEARGVFNAAMAGRTPSEHVYDDAFEAVTAWAANVAF